MASEELLIKQIKELALETKKANDIAEQASKKFRENQKENKKLDLTTDTKAKKNAKEIADAFRNSIKESRKLSDEYRKSVKKLEESISNNTSAKDEKTNKEILKSITDLNKSVKESQDKLNKSAGKDVVDSSVADAINESGKINTKFTLSAINDLANKQSKAVGKNSDDLKSEITGRFADELFNKLDATNPSKSILSTAKDTITQLSVQDEHNTIFDKRAKLRQAEIVKRELDNVAVTSENQDVLLALQSQNDSVITQLKNQSSAATGAKDIAKKQFSKIIDGVTGFLAADSPIMGIVIGQGKDFVAKIKENKKRRKEEIKQKERDFAQHKLIEEEKEIQKSHFDTVEVTEKSMDESLKKIADKDSGVKSKDKKTEKTKDATKKVADSKKENAKPATSNVKKKSTESISSKKELHKLSLISKNTKKISETVKDIKKMMVIQALKSLIPSFGGFGGRRPKLPGRFRGGRNPRVDVKPKRMPIKDRLTNLKDGAKNTAKNVGGKIKTVGGTAGRFALNGAKVAARFAGPAAAVAGAGYAGYQAGTYLSKKFGLTNEDGTVNDNNAGTKAIQGGLNTVKDSLSNSSLGRGALSLVGIDTEDPAVKKKRESKFNDKKYSTLVKNGVSEDEARQLANGPSDAFVKKLHEINLAKKSAVKPDVKNNPVGEHLSTVTKIDNKKNQNMTESSANAATQALSVATKNQSNVSNNTTVINNPNGTVQNEDVSVFNMMRGYMV